MQFASTSTTAGEPPPFPRNTTSSTELAPSPPLILHNLATSALQGPSAAHLSLKRRQITASQLQQEFQHFRQTFGENRLASIRKLDLTGNRLGDDLDVVSLPPHLDSLHLASNQLTALETLLLRSSISSQLAMPATSSMVGFPLCQLTHLDLSQNRLQGAMPAEMPRLMPLLEVLNLCGNRINALPASIGTWKRMRIFLCGSECGGGNLVEELPATIGKMTALVELDFSHNRLRSLPFTVGEIGSNLRTLNVFGNQLEQLPDTLLLLRNLRTLNVARNRLTLLPDTLVEMHALEMVDLSNNQLHALPVELANFLKARTTLLVGNPFDIKKAVDMDPIHRRLLLKSQSMPNVVLRLLDEHPPQEASGASTSSAASTSTGPSRRAPAAPEEPDFDAADLPLAPSHPDPLPAMPPVAIAPMMNAATQVDAIDMVMDMSALTADLPDESLSNPSPVPTLLELCARVVVANDVVRKDPKMLNLPNHLAQLLCLRGGCCYLCDGVYVSEFHSHIHPVPKYMGHSQIPHQLRLCSESCLRRCQSAQSMGSKELDARLLDENRSELYSGSEILMPGPGYRLGGAADLPSTPTSPSHDSQQSSLPSPRIRYIGKKREKKLWKWMDRVQHFQNQRTLSQGDLIMDW